MLKNIAEGLLIFAKYNAGIIVGKSKRYEDTDSDDYILIFLTSQSKLDDKDLIKLVELGWKSRGDSWKFDL